MTLPLDECLRMQEMFFRTAEISWRILTVLTDLTRGRWGNAGMRR